MYVVMSLVLCGTMCGWAGRRRRFYAVGAHSAMVTQIFMSLGNVIPLGNRSCMAAFKDFFIAEPSFKMN